MIPLFPAFWNDKKKIKVCFAYPGLKISGVATATFLLGLAASARSKNVRDDTHLSCSKGLKILSLDSGEMPQPVSTTEISKMDFSLMCLAQILTLDHNLFGAQVVDSLPRWTTKPSYRAALRELASIREQVVDQLGAFVRIAPPWPHPDLNCTAEDWCRSNLGPPQNNGTFQNHLTLEGQICSEIFLETPEPQTTCNQSETNQASGACLKHLFQLPTNTAQIPHNLSCVRPNLARVTIGTLPTSLIQFFNSTPRQRLKTSSQALHQEDMELRRQCSLRNAFWRTSLNINACLLWLEACLPCKAVGRREYFPTKMFNALPCPQPFGSSQQPLPWWPGNSPCHEFPPVIPLLSYPHGVFF